MTSAAAQHTASTDTVDRLKKLNISDTDVTDITAAWDTLCGMTGTTEERNAAAMAFAETVHHAGIKALHEHHGKINAALKSSKPDHRLGALLAAAAVCDKVGQIAEPYVVALLPAVLDCYADKVIAIRSVAESTGQAIVKMSNLYAVKHHLLPILFDAMAQGKKWQSKLGALVLLGGLANSAPTEIAATLPDIIPHVTDCMWDTKTDVKKAATACMSSVCAVVGNGDIEPFLPALVGCIADPSKVPECIYKLAATTFVKTVEAPTLAIMVPLLVRALNERATAVKRQAAVVIDNMCKLVEDPQEAHLFLPKLRPGLERVIDVTADPECREVATRAHATLLKAGGEGDVEDAPLNIDITKVLDMLHAIIAKDDPSFDMADSFNELNLRYVAGLCAFLVDLKCIQKDEWLTCCVDYLVSFTSCSEKASEITVDFLAKCDEWMKSQVRTVEEDDDEGVDLCNCEFSLAYGGMILLNNTKLRLKRGRRYGLCGPNGVGKSTLMRAIANGQLEGFPSKDVLKTVFVEHNLQASEAELSVVDFVLNDEQFADVSRDTVVSTLAGVGFTDDMQAQQVASLSGGWKMKLELARAMLMNADILLLDEPTNHLDVGNVKWLEDYLNGLTNVTSMLVSHDSGFLDNVCTDIIHYENRKLKRYRGNLSEFVKVKPEARSYYELEAATFEFKFPEPGYLDGINSKGKKILKMAGVGFTYPGATKQALSGITVSASLSSRVGCLGPNGAGKSTLIKLLTGEMEPTSGEVWKHPALRCAYVAQHAFHHIESHLDKTPNQYIQWRFQYGDDRELAAKDSRQLGPEEEALLKKQFVFDGEKRILESIENRRKLKKDYEYEVKWKNTPTEENSWVPREKLEKWGFIKLLQIADDREAARANLAARPLTAGVVQKHLDNFGLNAEFGTHSHMRGLSGGQKVKVVLAAAMWQNPHMVVLDEPTNYLDRDSLGALATAIKNYEGGVIIISHNSEFTSALCTEQWNVNAGRLTISGDTTVDKTRVDAKDAEDSIDAFGNKVKGKKAKKTLSRKEKKQREKKVKEKLAAGQEITTSDEEFI